MPLSGCTATYVCSAFMKAPHRYNKLLWPETWCKKQVINRFESAPTQPRCHPPRLHGGDPPCCCLWARTWVMDRQARHCALFTAALATAAWHGALVVKCHRGHRTGPTVNAQRPLAHRAGRLGKPKFFCHLYYFLGLIARGRG